jgi:ectoine hydroxylase-related dioxygenase (phytanoyl-CoA dioxygenase family)
MIQVTGELRVSNDAFDDPAEIRRRMDEEGYLFFKGLQDKDKLMSLRKDMLTVMMEGGWLVAGTDPVDGVADITKQCTEGDVAYTNVYRHVQAVESFHQSGHWPEVVSMIEKIVDGPVLPHPQKITRLWFPKYTDHTTPIHQDFVHFQGSFDTYTCWAPVGDCPTELGPLALVPGSHKVDKVLDHHFSLGAGALAILKKDLDDQWLSNDFEAGDTLVFHSLTAHRALPNLSEDRMRVSLDNRYQAFGIPIAEQMLTPHLSNFADFDWEDVYANWESDELKYYWKQYDLEVSAKIETWGRIGFEEAMGLAKDGDTNARHHLERIVKRDPEGEQSVAVARLLGMA